MSYVRAIHIGCTHGDVFDETTRPIVERLIEEWQPKYRVHHGDFLDLRALRNGASPEEKMDGISQDISCGKHLLEWFRPTHLTLGNHDHRLWKAAQQASNGVVADLCYKVAGEIEEFLRELRIRWCPWGVENYLTLPHGGPKLIHGTRSTMYPARAHFECYGPCITAHVHKPDSHHARHIEGGKAFCVGTLADIRKLEYANANTAKLGWRQSVLISLHNEQNGVWDAWEAVNRNGTWMTPMGALEAC